MRSSCSKISFVISSWAPQPFEGRAQRRPEGNRIHHYFDDRVASGGVHSRSVHGWDPGPFVPGIRGYHHGGDSECLAWSRSRFTPMLCSRLPARPRSEQETQLGIYRVNRMASSTCHVRASYRLRRCSGVSEIPADVMGSRAFFAVVGRRRCICTDKVPKGFIPDQDNDQINLQPGGGCRALRSTRWWTTRSRQLADAIRKDPNVVT